MLRHHTDRGASSPRHTNHTLITYGADSCVYETDTLRQVHGPPRPLTPGTRLFPTLFQPWERQRYGLPEQER
jgi:hypothetical protein